MPDKRVKLSLLNTLNSENRIRDSNVLQRIYAQKRKTTDDGRNRADLMQLQTIEN